MKRVVAAAIFAVSAFALTVPVTTPSAEAHPARHVHSHGGWCHAHRHRHWVRVHGHWRWVWHRHHHCHGPRGGGHH